MTAREYCNLYNYEPERKLAWARGCVGLVFTQFDTFGRRVRSRFLPKEKCVTPLDLSRFVTKYNMEDWAMEGTDERHYANVEVIRATEESHGRVLYTFTVDTEN